MLFAAFCLLLAGLTGWIAAQSLLAAAAFRYRLIAGLIVAESALLASVQVAASAQLLGLTMRFEPWHAALMLLAVLAGTAALLGRRSRAARARSSGSQTPVPGYLWLSGIVIGGIYLIGAANAFDGYVIDYDAVSYHLLLPHHWLMDGSLAISNETNWRLGMPGNGEVAMWWFYAGGVYRWAFLAQWPSTACLFAAVYSLAFGLARSRSAAFSVTAITATLPIVYFQTFNGYIDVFAAAFLMGALALAQGVGEVSEKDSRAWYWMIGLACGIALGTKLVYVAFAGPLGVGLLLIAWSRTRSFGETARIGGILLAGMAATAAFWYLRAWLLTGNPVFPMGVEIGDWVLFEGMPSRNINPPDWAINRWVRTPAEWLIYPWLEWRHEPSLTSYSVDTGLGAVFTAFVPLGTAYLCWTAWRRRQDRALWVWVAGLVYCGVMWWFPLHQTLRFALVFMLLLVVASGPLLAVLSATRNRVFETVFFLAVVITSVMLSLEPAAFVVSRRLYDMRTRAEIYRYPAFVDDLPEGSTVLNLVAPNNFAMAGERMSNRVVGFFEARRELTMEFLTERKIDYIVGHESHESRVAGIEGVRLVHSEIYRDPVGLGLQPWRVWKVDRLSGDGL